MICVFSMITYFLIVLVFKKIYYWFKGKKFNARGNYYFYLKEEAKKIYCPYLKKNGKDSEKMENPHEKKKINEKTKAE